MPNRTHPFSKEQQEELRANIYTLRVTDWSLTLTLAFKQLAIEELKKPGKNFPMILREAGYDTKMLGQSRISALRHRILQEAASERGLHETAPSKELIAAKNLKKQQTRTAIRELQEHVDKLEQEVAFLKKISLRRNNP